MQRVFATEPAIRFYLQTLGGLLRVLIGHVIAVFAIWTLQHNIVSHNSFFCYLSMVFSFQQAVE